MGIEKLKARRDRLRVLVEKKNKVRKIAQKQMSEKQKIKAEIKKLKVENRKDLVMAAKRYAAATKKGYVRVKGSKYTKAAINRGKIILKNIDKQTDDILKW